MIGVKKPGKTRVLLDFVFWDQSYNRSSATGHEFSAESELESADDYLARVS